MWTVTLLLKPIVVVAHLLGGFATLALLVSLGQWRAARFRAPTRRLARARRRRRLPRSCCRSRSAAGRARTMRRSRARISRPARPSGGPRSPISRKVSCCGAGSASTTKAACSITRRAWPCTSRTAWAPSLAAVLVALLGLRLAREARRAPTARPSWPCCCCSSASVLVSSVFGVPLAVAVLHNGVAALLLLAVINANQRIRQR